MNGAPQARACLRRRLDWIGAVRGRCGRWGWPPGL